MGAPLDSVGKRLGLENWTNFVFYDQGNDQELHFERKAGVFYATLLRGGKVTKIGPVGTLSSSSEEIAKLIWRVVKEQNFFKNLYERLIQWTGRQSGYPNLKKVFDTALENQDVLLLGELSKLVSAVGAGVYEEGAEEEGWEEFEEEEEEEVLRSPRVTWKDLPPVVLQIADHFGRIYFSLIEEAFIFKSWEHLESWQRSDSDVDEVWFRYKGSQLIYEVYSITWWDWEEFHKTRNFKRKPMETGEVKTQNGTPKEVIAKMEQHLERLGYYRSVALRIAELAEVIPQRFPRKLQSPMAKAVLAVGLPLQKELSLLLSDLGTRTWED